MKKEMESRRLWKVKCETVGRKKHFNGHTVIVVQSLSRVQLYVTPWSTVFQASLSLIISQGLLKLMSTELVMPSNHLILCSPLLLLSSIFPGIRVFSSESALCIRCPKTMLLNLKSGGVPVSKIPSTCLDNWDPIS